MAENGPSKELVERWRSGDESAAAELHRRYAQRLCNLAERQMDQRLSRRVGADDVVQSVFRTFFRRTREGQYPIDDSGSLWSLLVRITLNKVRQQGVRHRAAKRDIGAEIYLHGQMIDPEVLARDPSPDEAAVLLDELKSFVDGLKDPEPKIVQLCLEGYSSSEIAAEVECTRWTVRRVLVRIGNRLRQQTPEKSGK